MDFTGFKKTWEDRRKRKPYLIALLLALLYITDIFFISGFLGMRFGIAGTVIHEMILAGMGIGVFLIFRGKLRVIFPFKKPEWVKIAGTLVLWLGTYLFTNWIVVIMSYFFPEQVMGAGEGINDLIANIPVLPGLFVIAVTPAICEEIAFRGALLSCFRGAKSKWMGIIIVSLFFGACHGSVWRMIPTAVLGIAMGYILLETENMLYNMLFHFVNNAVPILLLGVMTKLIDVFGGLDVWEMADSVENVRIPLASVGMEMAYAGAAPILIYIGIYLLHRGQPGYDKGMFPPEKKKLMLILIAVGIGLKMAGDFLLYISVGLEAAGAMRSIY
ncbi:MAG: CPBP family intramembrane metalloprotease [Eubacteriales bacterium]|nr:CPBP family intramembrane metalloprotease [Eubacteriales bacterium]